MSLAHLLQIWIVLIGSTFLFDRYYAQIRECGDQLNDRSCKVRRHVVTVQHDVFQRSWERGERIPPEWIIHDELFQPRE